MGFVAAIAAIVSGGVAVSLGVDATTLLKALFAAVFAAHVLFPWVAPLLKRAS